MKARRWMWIVWPAFLMAAVLEMLVFAFVDPSEMHWQGHSLGLSREAIYTLTFFVFWGATVVSSALTTLLSMSPFEVNRCPLPAAERPRDCAQGGDCC
ncbi:hypothetical protein LPB72_11930 [Hydrogenophaga crassostreae]|uniref:Transmembrane protein n=1 Tax=Hydrogenophaga crassostreae TaxID=1763535 RepID=A0A167I0R1_9BURK|nr:hypothetical protein [Hydrogenophaga crassostreae]AOW13681.1 hypothetical protein LPB072_13310 [Hydrogenophaga crassostreae]OAD41977.1 hypothetical protein LPB72_11930 [Hydrogenophaga crassostreae]